VDVAAAFPHLREDAILDDIRRHPNRSFDGRCAWIKRNFLVDQAEAEVLVKQAEEGAR